MPVDKTGRHDVILGVDLLAALLTDDPDSVIRP
jgi:hypothetical protein